MRPVGLADQSEDTTVEGRSAVDAMAAPRWPQRWLGSIRVRILALVVILPVVASIGSVLALRAVLFEQLEDEVAVSLQREAEEFRLLSTGIDPITGEPFAGDLPALFDVYFAREIPDEGETLLAFLDGDLYQDRRAQDAADADEIRPAIDYWLSLDRREEGSIDTALGLARYVALPLTGRDGDGLFVVANFPAFEQEEIDEAVTTHVVVQMITMVLVAGLGLFLAGRVLRPLQSLAETAPTISDTDMHQRIPVTGRDEASLIATAFNDMLARLERAFAAQQRFLHDTSHELRSPLTVIRGHAELIGLDDTAADRAATVDLITDEVDRMSRIVNDLFLLAMSEHPDFLQVEPLDLRQVVLEAHQKVSVLAARDWQIDAPDAVPVSGDRQRLTQAIVQLVANAVKVTTTGDRIVIGTRVHDGNASLWVEDSGPGVPSDRAEQIFARAARGDSTDGAGLGLAIVRAIADAHHGTVTVRSRPGSGARFVITLPAAETTA